MLLSSVILLSLLHHLARILNTGNGWGGSSLEHSWSTTEGGVEGGGSWAHVNKCTQWILVVWPWRGEVLGQRNCGMFWRKALRDLIIWFNQERKWKRIVVGLIFWTYLHMENDERACRLTVTRQCGRRKHMGHYFRSASSRWAEDSWLVNQLIFIKWLLHIWRNSIHESELQELDFNHKKETKDMKLEIEGLDMGQITKAGIQLPGPKVGISLLTE